VKFGRTDELPDFNHNDLQRFSFLFIVAERVEVRGRRMPQWVAAREGQMTSTAVRQAGLRPNFQVARREPGVALPNLANADNSALSSKG
jgi:hypothetical protein